VREVRQSHMQLLIKSVQRARPSGPSLSIPSDWKQSIVIAVHKSASFNYHVVPIIARNWLHRLALILNSYVMEDPQNKFFYLLLIQLLRLFVLLSRSFDIVRKIKCIGTVYNYWSNGVCNVLHLKDNLIMITYKMWNTTGKCTGSTNIFVYVNEMPSLRVNYYNLQMTQQWCALGEIMIWLKSNWTFATKGSKITCGFVQKATPGQCLSSYFSQWSRSELKWGANVSVHQICVKMLRFFPWLSVWGHIQQLTSSMPSAATEYRNLHNHNSVWLCHFTLSPIKLATHIKPDYVYYVSSLPLWQTALSQYFHCNYNTWCKGSFANHQPSKTTFIPIQLGIIHSLNFNPLIRTFISTLQTIIILSDSLYLYCLWLLCFVFCRMHIIMLKERLCWLLWG